MSTNKGYPTGEMGPFGNVASLTNTRAKGSWYADEAWFVASSNPWFLRGSAHFLGTDAGVFAFGDIHGASSSTYSFRVVLTP